MRSQSLAGAVTSTDGSAAPILRAQEVSVVFDRGRHRGRPVPAVDKVSLEVGVGETLGLAGESGSGKTTLGFAILGRHPLRSGTVCFDGTEISSLAGRARRPFARDMQMIFQDPYLSLNPRMRIAEIVEEPLIIHGIEKDRASRREHVRSLLAQCGLPEDSMSRLATEFSGGQRQRIAIARALALSPRFVVADEPTSALDVSVQAQIVNLMRDLQSELGLSYLFISHNLAVLRHISHRIAVMYGGRIVECAPTDSLFEKPKHPYTRALLSAIPTPDPRSDWLSRADEGSTGGGGVVVTSESSGCAYARLCPLATDLCREQAPPLARLEDADVACWHAA